MSNLINKAREKAVEYLDKDRKQTDNPHSTNAGPHSSNITNKVDPMVDSDRDHRNDPTSRVGGYGDSQTGHGYGGGVAQSDTYGSSNNNPGYNDPRSTNTGPHGSNVANKLDPRVDSDNDNRNDPTSRAGGYGNTQQHGDNYGQAGGPGGMGTSHTGHTGHTGHGGPGGVGNTHSGYGGAPTGGQGGYDNPQSTNDGPHRSNFANKLDPRVDSDRDGRNDPTSGGHGTGHASHGHNAPGQTMHDHTTHGGHGGAGYGGAGDYGAGEPGAGHTGGYGASGPGAGGYNSGATGGYGDSSYTPGSGDARKTAGPHNSDMMNKIDPRVDSDMDGSKTYGGNATHR